MRFFTLLTAAVFSVVVRADSNTAATAASAASVPSSSAVAVSASSFTNVTLQTALSASLSQANYYVRLNFRICVM